MMIEAVVYIEAHDPSKARRALEVAINAVPESGQFRISSVKEYVPKAPQPEEDHLSEQLVDLSNQVDELGELLATKFGLGEGEPIVPFALTILRDWVTRAPAPSAPIFETAEVTCAPEPDANAGAQNDGGADAGS